MSQEQFDEDHRPELETTATVVGKAKAVVDSAEGVLKFIKWAMIVIIFLLAYTSVMLNRVDGNTDKNANATEANAEATQDLTESVADLQRFVDQLEEVTPEEAARNDAITAAVNQVPSIKSILCEAFPEATACQPPPQ